MEPDQPAHPHCLIRIHAVRLQTLLQVKKLIVNSMDPDQTARSQTHYVGFVVTRLKYKTQTNLSIFQSFSGLCLMDVRNWNLKISQNQDYEMKLR
jgi:hypothetical protein